MFFNFSENIPGNSNRDSDSFKLFQFYNYKPPDVFIETLS